MRKLHFVFFIRNFTVDPKNSCKSTSWFMPLVATLRITILKSPYSNDLAYHLLWNVDAFLSWDVLAVLPGHILANLGKFVTFKMENNTITVLQLPYK